MLKRLTSHLLLVLQRLLSQLFKGIRLLLVLI
jgi:hypothetical protein